MKFVLKPKRRRPKPSNETLQSNFEKCHFFLQTFAQTVFFLIVANAEKIFCFWKKKNLQRMFFVVVALNGFETVLTFKLKTIIMYVGIPVYAGTH
jgi:hypothetical protein